MQVDSYLGGVELEHYRRLIEKYQRELLCLMIMLLIAIGMVMFFFKEKEEPPSTIPKSNTVLKNNSVAVPNSARNKTAMQISDKASLNKKVSKTATASDFYNQLPLRNPFKPPNLVKNSLKGEVNNSFFTGNSVKNEGTSQRNGSDNSKSYSLQLEGIISYKGKWTALLEYGGQHYSCSVGDKVGPYQVIQVSEQLLRLKQGQEQLQLKL